MVIGCFINSVITTMHLEKLTKVFYSFDIIGNNVVITKVRFISWIPGSQCKQNGSILAGHMTEILMLAKLVSTIISTINFVKRL